MKRRLKGLCFDYFIINLGLILASIGISVFLVPGKLVSSGASGIATILFYSMGTPVGLSILIINIPIFILGVKVFGKEYGLKTLFGIVGISLYTQIFQTLSNNTSIIDYAKGGNLLLAPIFGGLFLGSGMGLIFKFGGSTGGGDILGQVISKYTKLPVSYAILILDVLVMGSGIIVFGIESGLYAILSAFTCNLILNKIFEGVSNSKMVYITSSEHDKVQEILTNDLQTESTVITTKSDIHGSEKKMIMAILRNKEIRDLQAFMKRIDPTAYIVISEVYEIFGNAETEKKS